MKAKSQKFKKSKYENKFKARRDIYKLKLNTKYLYIVINENLNSGIKLYIDLVTIELNYYRD